MMAYSQFSMWSDIAFFGCIAVIAICVTAVKIARIHYGSKRNRIEK